MERPILTQDFVLSLFEYRDGELYWKYRPRSHFTSDLGYLQWNPRNVGKRAGSHSGKYKNKYVEVKIDYFTFGIHRIIFLMHHGYLPEQVDHVDCDVRNNRIENLRAATKSENLKNRPAPKHNTSGHKGVCWSKNNKKWVVTIRSNKKCYSLGYYSNLEEAGKVAETARKVLHGEFARS